MWPRWLWGEGPGEEHDGGKHLRWLLVVVPVMQVALAAVMVRAAQCGGQVQQFQSLGDLVFSPRDACYYLKNGPELRFNSGFWGLGHGEGQHSPRKVYVPTPPRPHPSNLASRGVGTA